MQETLETRVTLLEKEDTHISHALNEHSKRTEHSLNEIKTQVSIMVQLQTEIVGISRDLSSMMQKHDRLEENINKRLNPIETFMSNTKFALFLIKNTPIIAATTGIIGAAAYFLRV
jgi:predicted  nucleic acid-binding Zn-ribbon protein